MTALLDPRLSDCRRIFLDALTIDASIGFHDVELTARQRVQIDVDLFVPLRLSTPRSDDVAEVLDYDRFRRAILELTASRHFNLQETLLDGIVELCLVYPEVRAVRARTRKPDVYPDCESVGVEVFRFRDPRA